MRKPRSGIGDEAAFWMRSVVVAAKETLGLPRRSDATFYVERFTRWLNSGRIGRNVAVMALGKSDGAGSQAQAAMSAICFAKAHGVPYIHRPFTHIEHPETDMPAWVRSWEEYFNLGAFERRIADETAPVVPLERLKPRAGGEPVIVAAPHYLRFCNRDPAAWERAAPLLRAKFWEAKQRPSRSGEINVAIHMRRGDVSAHNQKVANNFTPNATFVNTLTCLQRLLGSERGGTARFSVYSQGDPSMFADLAALGAELHLDTPALDTHRALVEADVLVMSKGAFSYTAGVLNDGIVLYDPHKYRPMSDWITRARDGSFDVACLKSRLEVLLCGSKR